MCPQGDKGWDLVAALADVKQRAQEAGNEESAKAADAVEQRIKDVSLCRAQPGCVCGHAWPMGQPAILCAHHVVWLMLHICQEVQYAAPSRCCATRQA